MGRLREGWLQIVACFAEVQTLSLLGLIYVLVIGPASLVSRAVRSDFLSKRELGRAGSAWREAGIGVDGVVYLAFYDKPCVKFERFLLT